MTKRGVCHMLAVEKAAAPKSLGFHVSVVLCSGASLILY